MIAVAHPLGLALISAAALGTYNLVAAAFWTRGDAANQDTAMTMWVIEIVGLVGFVITFGIVWAVG